MTNLRLLSDVPSALNGNIGPAYSLWILNPLDFYVSDAR